MATTSNKYKEYQDKVLNTFADMMIEKIKSFEGDWHKPWFTEGFGGWATNFEGRTYSGGNAFMLALLCAKEGYNIPLFTTHNYIENLNWTKDKEGKRVPATDKEGNKLPLVHVIKGSKSFPVFFNSIVYYNPQTKQHISSKEYDKLNDEDKKEFKTYFNNQVYNVFNIQQTNLKEARPDLYAKITAKYSAPKPQAKSGKEFKFAPMDKMIKHGLWLCPIRPVYGDGAYYSISNDEIVIPEKKQFNNGESFYSNLFHEMAHSTGAKSRLDRLQSDKMGDASYATEELVAEMTAALVASNYGIDKYLKEDSVAYLKNWLGCLKKSPDYIKTILNDVKRAADMITLKIEEAKAYKTKKTA